MVDGKGFFRPDGYVLERILKILREDNRYHRKTELAMRAIINYDNLLRYLPYMKNEGMITVKTGDDGHELIKITDFGIETHEGLTKWVLKKGLVRLPLSPPILREIIIDHEEHSPETKKDSGTSDIRRPRRT